MSRLPVRVFRRLYGEHPLHLALLTAAFALAAYAVGVLGVRNLFNPAVWWQSIAVWFAVAVIGHDLILFPLYAIVDRLIPRQRRAAQPVEAERAPDAGRVPVTNYVRIPCLASGLLLLMFLPGIIEQGAFSYHVATGLTQEPYLHRWLLLTASFFVVATLWYGVKTMLRHRSAGRPLGGATAPSGSRRVR